MSVGGALLEREDRWSEVLERLRVGGDYGVESKGLKKSCAFVTILGRRMTIGEAADLSGIDNEFYKKYEGKEVPVEDIVNKLNQRWINEKKRRLKAIFK